MTTNHNTADENSIIPAVGLTEIDGEPHARDIEIAERLGMSRPRDIRQLIERNIAEIEGFGPARRRTALADRPQGGGSGAEEYWLSEEQALLVAALSKAPKAAAVRAMLIRTFVAWRRGHLNAADQHLTKYDAAMIGNIVKNCTGVVIREQLAAALPLMLDAMVAAKLAEQNYLLRHGKTAGQIWKAHGFPRLKVTSWFSNRLSAMGCQIEGGGKGELGLGTAKLFDPDKAANWLRNGGSKMVKDYIASRQGQGKLRLIIAREDA